MSSEGISVIICTYNGSLRLTETIKYLAIQKKVSVISWEIIIIDNNSTDNTLIVATELKQKYEYLSIRVLQEYKPGKINAINLGIKESNYGFIIICDDDCWISDNYLITAYETLCNNPQVAVVNGRYTNVFDFSIPHWFKLYEKKFIENNWGDQPLDITDTVGSTGGAGMVLRKKAYLRLQKLGFENVLSGGKGDRRYAGEDTEMCLALRLLGYKIMYNPDLSFQHFMPADRVTWEKIREVNRANGEASVFYNPYRFYYAKMMGKEHKIYKSWWSELSENLRFFINFRTWLSYLLMNKPGNWAVLRIERQLSKLKTLIKFRKEYKLLYKKIELLISKQ